MRVGSGGAGANRDRPGGRRRCSAPTTSSPSARSTALRKRIGLRVLEDVLIAGFDDIPSASWAGFDLATFVHDGPRMVDEALSILRAAETAHAPVGEVRVVVPARLVERGTTRR